MISEYIYRNQDVVNVIQHKYSSNKKLGLGRILTTYHFHIDQIRNINLKLDSQVCMDCPFAYSSNNELSGKCYTHKGRMRVGLYSMLNRLSKMEFDQFDGFLFNKFLEGVHDKVDLCRFGAYSEPVLLPISIVEALISKSRKHTGYTHQWHKTKYQAYSKYFMASTHSSFESNLARSFGFRTFSLESDSDSVNCPASKESNYKTTCVKCGLCNGASLAKNVYIHKH